MPIIFGEIKISKKRSARIFGKLKTLALKIKVLCTRCLHERLSSYRRLHENKSIIPSFIRGLLKFEIKTKLSCYRNVHESVKLHPLNKKKYIMLQTFA